MAMNANALASAIKSAVDAINESEGSVSNDAVLQALASAIVDHIQTNAKAVYTGGSSPAQLAII